MVAVSGRGWRLAPCLVELVRQSDDRAPGRSHRSDGSVGDLSHQARESDHNPADGWVCAVDITDDKANGCDADLLAQHIVAGRDPRVKYVIWNRTIAKSYASGGRAAWTPYPYTGANPHNSHTHVSVHNTAAARNDLRPWWPGPQEDDMAQYDDLLNRIEFRLISVQQGLASALDAIEELDGDIPENLTAQLAEVRVNLRRDMQADGVPDAEIGR